MTHGRERLIRIRDRRQTSHKMKNINKDKNRKASNALRYLSFGLRNGGMQPKRVEMANLYKRGGGVKE